MSFGIIPTNKIKDGDNGHEFSKRLKENALDSLNMDGPAPASASIGIDDDDDW